MFFIHFIWRKKVGEGDFPRSREDGCGVLLCFVLFFFSLSFNFAGEVGLVRIDVSGFDFHFGVELQHERHF